MTCGRRSSRGGIRWRPPPSKWVEVDGSCGDGNFTTETSSSFHVRNGRQTFENVVDVFAPGSAPLHLPSTAPTACATGFGFSTQISTQVPQVRSPAVGCYSSERTDEVSPPACRGWSGGLPRTGGSSSGWRSWRSSSRWPGGAAAGPGPGRPQRRRRHHPPLGRADGRGRSVGLLRGVDLGLPGAPVCLLADGTPARRGGAGPGHQGLVDPVRPRHRAAAVAGGAALGRTGRRGSQRRRSTC